ncbi:hypothetical protein Bca101_024876 [Brassica carinata]
MQSRRRSMMEKMNLDGEDGFRWERKGSPFWIWNNARDPESTLCLMSNLDQETQLQITNKKIAVEDEKIASSRCSKIKSKFLELFDIEKAVTLRKRAATAVASTLGSWKVDNEGGGYSAHYLMKSSSLSSSKCIYVQYKTGI